MIGWNGGAENLVLELGSESKNSSEIARKKSRRLNAACVGSPEKQKTPY